MLEKRKIVGILLILLILTGTTVLCQPKEEFSTTITYIEGEVEVLKKGEKRWIKAKLKMKLSKGDKIRTGLLSKAELTTPEDESVIKLGENTIFEIKNLSKYKGRIISEFKLLIGELWARVKRITIFGSKFEISTPTAIMGIRGTIFSAYVDEQGITYCTVEEGEIYFRGIYQPPEEEIILREGESAKSSADGMSVSKYEETAEEKEEREERFSAGVNVFYRFSTFEPYVAYIPEITFIFIPTDPENIPYPINITIDGVKYEVFSLNWVYIPPHLEAGINNILVEVSTKGGFPTIFNITTPYYDPFFPEIQSIEQEITPDYKLKLRIRVNDAHSGIKEVRANGVTLSEVTDGEYEWLSSETYLNIDRVIIEAEDMAKNKTIEVFLPISRDLPPPPPE